MPSMGPSPSFNLLLPASPRQPTPRPAPWQQAPPGSPARHASRLRAFLLLGSLALALGGCIAPAPLAPVGGSLPRPGYHQVRHGDTLYNIAYRHGLDYRELARANRIAAPYTIRIGQRLRLSRKVAPQADSGPPASAGAAKPAPRPQPSGAASKAPLPASRPQFLWPVQGQLLGRFSLSQPVNKGIDIAARKGAPVKASASGLVVYAGGNLRGYGKLVIIKHNDKYLTAYGNNDKILVKEGDRVERGEAIARIGVDASQRELLHFEIREDGKPKDPLKFLPR